MKKIICFVLALTLLCGAAFAQSNVTKVFDAAAALAFDTENVTVSAEAVFSYDGEVFKTMHASYEQDGVKSYLSYMLDTPQTTGNVYTGGFTVLGLGDTAYSNDTYLGNYYSEHGTLVKSTLLSGDNRTDMAVSLARGLAALAAETGYITETENGEALNFSAGRLPDAINAAAYYLTLDYIYDNYYRDFFHIYDEHEEVLNINYENYTESINAKYKLMFGEDMPDEPEAGRYNLAEAALAQQERELMQQYTVGYAVINGDCSVDWYEDMDAYVRATGNLAYEYADFEKQLKRYYYENYGTELTDEMITCIMCTANPDLWNAYTELTDAIDAEYKQRAVAQNPDAVYFIVNADDSITTYSVIPGYYTTLTQRILYTLDYAALTSINADVTLDEQGRLTGFAGEAVFALTDNLDTEHELKISFECKAGAYGETRVPDEFVPENYGLVSYEEFWENRYAQSEEAEFEDPYTEFFADAPETIEFMNQTYETMIGG